MSEKDASSIEGSIQSQKVIVALFDLALILTKRYCIFSSSRIAFSWLLLVKVRRGVGEPFGPTEDSILKVWVIGVLSYVKRDGLHRSEGENW